MSLAERIRKTRKDKGIKLYELASSVGMSQQALVNIENGSTTKSTYLISIAKFLGVSASWLEFGGEIAEETEIDLSSEEIALIYNFRLLDETDQKAVSKIVNALKIQAFGNKNA